MKVRVITPIRVRRRQERYDRLAPAGWEIHVEDLPDGPDSPRELGNRDQIAASERIGLAAGRETDPERFDALLPDCVLDPSLRDLDAASPVPVLGITRLSAHLLAALGIRFGVVTRNETIAEEYRAVMERYGLGEAFQGAYVLGLSVEDISDHATWNEAVIDAARRAHSEGVTVLVNGCSAVEVVFDELDVRVVDPTALALRTAAFSTSEQLAG